MTLSTSDKLNLGVAYYPEHWPEVRWAADAHQMQAAGISVVRMGEFAWSTFEPEEGVFDFEWLERAIALLAEHGIRTVLGTPTAAPPAWLSHQYPQILALDAHGQRARHGKRCHYCVNSPVYHEHVRRIVGAMAVRFAANPHVIGWQLDNEFNQICYCETCRARFQEYLRSRFTSLADLNAHWTTAYWSQTYSDWEQIPLPGAGDNPGLLLEFHRFVSDSYQRFQRLQLEALRPLLPEQVWVTHNFMEWFDGYDHYTLAADLDLAAWDWYVGAGRADHLKSGAAHDLVRGFKRQNFWVMETQPGHVNWKPVNPSLDKGAARAMAWHAVGHGAAALLYWQWRPALGGQEQYHGSLIDASGQPRPFYAEAQQLGEEFERLSDLLAGAQINTRVAILNDYASRWSLQQQPHHQNFDYVEHLLHYYRPLARRNVPVDIISADASLNGYRLVIAPALLILSSERVERLKAFVARGGVLILTARTGMKDSYNALLPARQPGELSEISGVEVEDFYALERPVLVKGKLLDGHTRIWAERLRVLGHNDFTQVVARYAKSNGWLDDQPAVTVNPYQRGFVYYIGAYLDDHSQSKLLEYICDIQGIAGVMRTPSGVEACRLTTTTGQQVYFLINHEANSKIVEIPWPAHEHLGGHAGKGQLTLTPYGVAILTQLEQ